MPDKIIYKYSLILFDFDSYELTPSNEKILERDVVPKISYRSTVKVYGFTDRIGDREYNRQLALKRAKNVVEFLKKRAKGASYQYFGVGEDEFIFDNDSPIGRQLSRTVQIYVINPK